MNFVLHGYPVSSGITVGSAHLVSTARLEVAHYEVAPEAVEAEVARFDAAMKTAQEGLAALKAHATQVTTDGPFFALSNNVGSTAWGIEYYRIAKGTLGPVGEDGGQDTVMV